MVPPERFLPLALESLVELRIPQLSTKKSNSTKNLHLDIITLQDCSVITDDDTYSAY